jgi:hypothetical protein
MGGSGLSDQARAIRAEYYREWRKRNPQKQQEYIARYWERRTLKQNKEQAPNGEKDEKV